MTADGEGARVAGVRAEGRGDQRARAVAQDRARDATAASVVDDERTASDVDGAGDGVLRCHTDLSAQ